MKIVCLGWGSLIWDSRELNIPSEEWHEDGPALPVEFSRKSSDGRMTLIIDEQASPQVVLWAELKQEDLDDARCLLARREGTKFKNIHFARVGDSSGNSSEINSKVANWLKIKDLDVAIWTGLSYGGNGERPGASQVIEHLQKLKGCGRERAEKYVRKAPVQIDTEYRRKIEAKLGWTPRDD